MDESMGVESPDLLLLLLFVLVQDQWMIIGKFIAIVIPTKRTPFFCDGDVVIYEKANLQHAICRPWKLAGCAFSECLLHVLRLCLPQIGVKVDAYCTHKNSVEILVIFSVFITGYINQLLYTTFSWLERLSPHQSDQMSLRLQVSWINLWTRSVKVFVFVFVFVISAFVHQTHQIQLQSG